MTRRSAGAPRHGKALRIAGTVLLAAALAAGWLWLVRSDAWHDALAWMQLTQRDLHRHLSGAMRAAGGSPGALWTLIGLSLAYGVFHAAGPGHGKAVIATYLGSNRVLLKRGLLLSLLSSLMQGFTAIVIVEVARGLLGLSMRHTQNLGLQLENLSFALVALLGAVLAGRSAADLWQRRGQRETPDETTGLPPGSLFAGGGAMQAYCVDCGAMHGPSRQHIEEPLSWRTAGSIVLSIGLRPCTGALLVLLVAYSLGMRQAGIAAVLAMSLGTAATVGAIAAATVFARQGALRVLRALGRDDWRLQRVFDIAGLVGGLLILTMGINLLQQGLQTSSHPLL